MRTRILLLLCGWLFAVGPGLAQTKTDGDWPAQAERQLERLQREVQVWDRQPPTLDRVGERYREVLDLRRGAEECITTAGSALEATRLKLEALGPVAETEAADVRQRRRELEDERKKIERQQGMCRLLALGGKELIDQIQQERQSVISRALLTRGAPVWEIGLASLQPLTGQGEPLPAPDKQLAFDPVRTTAVAVVSLIVLLPIALGLGGWLREKYGAAELPPASATMVARMYALRLPWVAGIGAIASGLAIGGAAPLAAPLLGVIGSLLAAPLLQLLVCGADPACRAGRPARVLLGIVLFAVAVMLVGASAYLPEAVHLSLRAIYVLILGLVSLWLLYALSRRSDFQNLRSLRLPLAVALLSGPVAEWLGYRALGTLLVAGVYGTFAGAILTWLLYQALIGGLNGLDAGQSQGAQRLRQFLGYKADERIRSIPILKGLIGIGLLLAFGYSLLAAWQVSEADTAALRDVVTGGFQVGAMTIVPSRLLGALLMFLLLVLLTRWLRRQLEERWLRSTRLDAGARQSVVALTSYAIIASAILLTLSMAGLELSNVALIAGALSVGIGFGLQNIVSNFISGLILLFERPVRPGDWVQVGATQGYVKKVSIRYTLIQTFERADVLVPNSELISNQVTNWMLNDPFGRVEVPVGVAYGTDTDLVRELLLQAANDHPLVMKNDPRVLSPRVLFMNFGDSSLNFELRCFIRQVDQRLSVRSDLLFAIDKAFRAAGIEIPFPQRVVHQIIEPPLQPRHDDAPPA